MYMTIKKSNYEHCGWAYWGSNAGTPFSKRVSKFLASTLYHSSGIANLVNLFPIPTLTRLQQNRITQYQLSDTEKAPTVD